MPITIAFQTTDVQYINHLNIINLWLIKICIAYMYSQTCLIFQSLKINFMVLFLDDDMTGEYFSLLVYFTYILIMYNLYSKKNIDHTY